MKILTLGSTGKIGRLVVGEAETRGWTERAAVREAATSASLDLETSQVVLDLADPDSLDAALDGVDAVVSCLGPRTNTTDEVGAFEANARNLVGAMDRTGVRRAILLSEAGVSAPGDRRSRMDGLMLRVVRRMARHTVAAEQAEFDVVAAGDLDWTALRPPFVVDGDRTGRYTLSADSPPMGARITRSDIAAAMLDQVKDDTWIRAAPFAWAARD